MGGRAFLSFPSSLLLLPAYALKAVDCAPFSFFSLSFLSLPLPLSASLSRYKDTAWSTSFPLLPVFLSNFFRFLPNVFDLCNSSINVQIEQFLATLAGLSFSAFNLKNIFLPSSIHSHSHSHSRCTRFSHHLLILTQLA